MNNYLLTTIDPPNPPESLNRSSFGNPVLGETLKNMLLGDSSSAFLNLFLPNFIKILFIIGVIIFIFMIILGAIAWISSGGDKTAIENARNKITNALIGIFILFSVFALFAIVETFFGVNILSIDIAPLIIR